MFRVRDQKEKFHHRLAPLYIEQSYYSHLVGTLSPTSAMASERAKKLGKKIIAYPEDQPSALSSKDWIDNLVKEDPKDFVS